MALATEKSVFLHIPKTGGMFIRHAFRACGIQHYEIGDQHSHFPLIMKYNDKKFYDNRFIFAFVRHPLTWYQSRWAFRVKHGWRAQHPLDYNCATNDFSVFIHNMLEYKPNGWVTEEYSNYIDEVPGGIEFVGRTENIVEDLIKAFKMAGEKFDERIIRSIQRTNDSDMDGKPSKYWAPYNEMLANRVMAVEQQVIRRYYSDGLINPNNLYGLRPY